MNDIAIVGNGGFAKEVKWLIEECNQAKKKWNIIGWISREEPGTVISGLSVLGGDDWLINYDKPIAVVLGIGDRKLRKKIVESYRKNKNIWFPNIISPTARLSESISWGEGCIVTANSIFTVNISIGNFLICNLASTIGHDCVINDYVTLFPGVHISGNVTLGECVSVGTGANIIQGLSVGDNTFIGAGAAVVRDLPSDCVAVGMPAKPIEKEGN